MLLTRLARFGRESGSALVAVLGVMAVGVILTTLIMSSLVGAMGYSTATRAGVQSHASADAGIVAARTALFTPGSCLTHGGTYTSTVPPIYSVRVEYNAGAGWQAGCPTIDATQVRLLSTGTAQAAGVAGVSSGNSSKVEAVFQYLTPGPVPSGPAVYLYGGGVVEANSDFDLSESTDGGVMIKNGDFVCAKNNGFINGSIVVDRVDPIWGNLTLSQGCSTGSDAWAANKATLGAASLIGGNLTAGSVSPNPPDAHLPHGTYTQGGTLPEVPGWVDVGYQPHDWLDASGAFYEERSVSGLGCSIGDGNLGGTTLGEPVIIDARSCAGLVVPTSTNTVTLTSDVVIFAKKFDFGNNVTFTSSTSQVHRLWFITQDGDTLDVDPAHDQDLYGNPTPTCLTAAGQGDFTMGNGFILDSSVEAMLYTPCAFQGWNTFEWHGQIYAGKMSTIKNTPKMTYAPMGIAGVDFNPHDPIPPVITKPQPGAVVSMRDVN
jgi:hypothetical protein